MQCLVLLFIQKQPLKTIAYNYFKFLSSTFLNSPQRTVGVGEETKLNKMNVANSSGLCCSVLPQPKQYFSRIY